MLGGGPAFFTPPFTYRTIRFSLSYYNGEDDEQPNGVLNLTPDTAVVDVNGDALKFDIITPGRTLHAKAENGDEKSAWQQALRKAVELISQLDASDGESDHEDIGDLPGDGGEAQAERTTFSESEIILEGSLVKRAVQQQDAQDGSRPNGPPKKKPQRNSLLNMSFLGKKKKGRALMPMGTATEQAKINKVSKKYKWRTRWFVLQGSSLAYYKSKANSRSHRSRCKGEFALNSECRVEESREKPFAWKLITPRRELHVFCCDDAEKKKWMDTLKAHIADLGKAEDPHSRSGGSKLAGSRLGGRSSLGGSRLGNSSDLHGSHGSGSGAAGHKHARRSIAQMLHIPGATGPLYSDTKRIQLPGEEVEMIAEGE